MTMKVRLMQLKAYHKIYQTKSRIIVLGLIRLNLSLDFNLLLKVVETNLEKFCTKSIFNKLFPHFLKMLKLNWINN